jgi:hypothetical protein
MTAAALLVGCETREPGLVELDLDGARVSVSPARLRLPDMGKNQLYVSELRLANLSDTACSFTIQGTCDCVQLGLTSGTLPANGDLSVPLNVHVGIERATIEATVRVTLMAPDPTTSSSVSIPISARVIPTIELDRWAQSVHVHTETNKPSTGSLTIVGNGISPERTIRAVTSPSGRLSLARFIREPSGRFQCEVKVAVPPQATSWKERAILWTNSESQENVTTVIEFHCAPAIELDPPSIALTDIRGTLATFTLIDHRKNASEPSQLRIQQGPLELRLVPSKTRGVWDGKLRMDWKALTTNYQSERLIIPFEDGEAPALDVVLAKLAAIPAQRHE